MVSAVEPDRLKLTLTIFALVRFTVTLAGADAGIIIGASVLARTPTLNHAVPVTSKAPFAPKTRQTTSNSARQLTFVWLALSASAAEDARIVPLASAPVPQ